MTAIDAVTTSTRTEDQRGFAISGGSADVGATEFQDFDQDHDGDGSSYGVEAALRTDPLVADPEDSRNFRITSFDANGIPTLTFGLDNANKATSSCVWCARQIWWTSPPSS